MATDKPPTPAYGSFKSLTTFFSARRDDEHITSVVDRSLMTNFSGSTANELVMALKFLKFIKDSGEPLPLYEKFVRATDEQRVALLAQVLRDAYPFIFASPTFNLDKATSAMTADVFRQQGLSGSTLSRAVSFFLAAAKAAGIKVSANIKAPQKPAVQRSRRAAPAGNGSSGEEREEEEEDEVPDGFQMFEIPIPINRKVRIMIPEDWSPGDWDLFQVMLTAYVDGWKKQSEKKEKKV